MKCLSDNEAEGVALIRCAQNQDDPEAAAFMSNSPFDFHSSPEKSNKESEEGVGQELLYEANPFYPPQPQPLVGSVHTAHVTDRRAATVRNSLALEPHVATAPAVCSPEWGISFPSATFDNSDGPPSKRKKTDGFRSEGIANASQDSDQEQTETTQEHLSRKIQLSVDALKKKKMHSRKIIVREEMRKLHSVLDLTWQHGELYCGVVSVCGKGGNQTALGYGDVRDLCTKLSQTRDFVYCKCNHAPSKGSCPAEEHFHFIFPCTSSKNPCTSIRENKAHQHLGDVMIRSEDDATWDRHLSIQTNQGPTSGAFGILLYMKAGSLDEKHRCKGPIRGVGKLMAAVEVQIPTCVIEAVHFAAHPDCFGLEADGVTSIQDKKETHLKIKEFSLLIEKHGPFQIKGIIAGNFPEAFVHFAIMMPNRERQIWNECVTSFRVRILPHIPWGDLFNRFGHTTKFSSVDPPNYAEQAKWLQYCLTCNQIDTVEFCSSVDCLLAGLKSKANTLWMYGVKSSGKSWIANAIGAAVVFCGDVVASKNFAFNNLAGKRLIHFQDLDAGTLSKSTAKTLKLLFEGQAVTTHMKYGLPEAVDGTPVIVTSNVPPTVFSEKFASDRLSVDAFMSRIITFTFTTTWQFPLDEFGESTYFPLHPRVLRDFVKLHSPGVLPSRFVEGSLPSLDVREISSTTSGVLGGPFESFGVTSITPEEVSLSTMYLASPSTSSPPQEDSTTSAALTGVLLSEDQSKELEDLLNSLP